VCEIQTVGFTLGSLVC